MENDVRDKYMNNARVMLSVRCCGISSFFKAESTGDKMVIEDELIANMSEASQYLLRSKWIQYLGGDLGADGFLEEVLQIVPVTIAETSKLGAAVTEVTASRFADPRRIPPSLQRLPALINDPERRASFQLALLQRFPMTETPCCGDLMCFRCKTSGWHHETCEERQRRQIGQRVCFCPHCGVPTVKSEGCDHMVCVCGQEWTWGANPLLQALQGDLKSVIEPLLMELADINEPLGDIDGYYGGPEAPMDIFLRYLVPSPEAIEIVKLFAKLGARASPQVHRARMREAMEIRDISLLKLLLNSFTGVSPLDLGEWLTQSIGEACRRRLHKHDAQAQAVEFGQCAEIVSLLVRSGADTSEAAMRLSQMSRVRQSRCPEELVKLIGSPCQSVMDDDILQERLRRATDLCTGKLRKKRHRANVGSKLTREVLTRKLHPRGGTPKHGPIDLQDCWTETRW
jgi:hypothetical protein